MCFPFWPKKERVSAGAVKQSLPEFVTEEDRTDPSKNRVVQAGCNPGIKFNLSLDQQLDKPSPPYTCQGNASPDVPLILEALRNCRDVGTKFGITNAFNGFSHRDWVIYIEADRNVPPAAKMATKFLCLILLQIGRALGTQMTFYFTTMTNDESDEITVDDTATDKALEKVWLTKSLADALKVINQSQRLKEIGLDTWFNELEEQVVNEGLNLNGRDKHIRLLNEVRNLRVAYHRGWSQSDLDTTKLTELLDTAWDRSGEQPLCRNSLRHTYERLTELYKIRRSDRDSHPTTAAVITSSPIQSSEVNVIQDFQRKTLNTFKRATVVEGEGTEFVITTYVFTGSMDDQPKKCYSLLDTKFEDKKEEDFLDTNFIDEESFLKSFLSPRQLLKLFNGHNKNVDHKVKFGNESEKYGNFPLTQKREITIPGVLDVKVALGQDVISDTKFTGGHGFGC